MGRKPLIQEKKHPLFYRMPPLKLPAAAADAGEGGSDAFGSRTPEWFMEQVMEGLSDACMLMDGAGRLLYVNGAAKNLLSPKGRILGRKLDAVLANRQLSMLAADVYHTGKPVFTKLELAMPGEGWRDGRYYHVSLVPLWINTTRRLVRLAMRDTPKDSVPAPRNAAVHEPEDTAAAIPPGHFSEIAMRLRNPLTILQGYLENLLDGAIKDPTIVRQTLLTMRRHTMAIENVMETCGK
jgi:nitrogen-specific signal transduction histidine kinase